MNDTITEFTRNLFKSHELQTVACLSYEHLLKGSPDALRLLSGYLVMRGCVVIIKGHEVRARSAGTRAINPPQIIFALHGGPRLTDVASSWTVGVNHIAYYLDKTGSAELMEMEDRYVDGNGEGPPDRSDEEGAVLRD